MATETADEALERVIRRVLGSPRAIGIMHKAMAGQQARAPFGEAAGDMENAQRFMRDNHQRLQALSAEDAWSECERYALCCRPGGGPERYAKEFATGPQPRQWGDPIVTAGGRKTPVQSNGGAVESGHVAPVTEYEARGLLATAARGRAPWCGTLLSVVQATLSDSSISRMCDSELGPFCERLDTKTRTAALAASRSHSPWAVEVLGAVQAAMNEDTDLARQARRAAD
jgi:hypothetical protein